VTSTYDTEIIDCFTGDSKCTVAIMTRFADNASANNAVVVCCMCVCLLPERRIKIYILHHNYGNADNIHSCLLNVGEKKDIMGSNCLKGVSGKVTVDEKGIKDSWKKYIEKLMNAYNEWDHRIEATVKEGPADCIRMDEVAAALKKIKRHKAPAT